MANRIKIKIDPKKKFGASAKKGEIAFRTLAHLNIFKKIHPVELRLIKAEAELEKTEALMKRAPQNRSINTMLLSLKRLESMEQFFFAQRMALLTNYRELKDLEQKASTENNAQISRMAARSTYKQVMRLEDLLQNIHAKEKVYKDHLTIALKSEIKLKSKKPKPVVQKVLSESEKEDANGLLDTRNLYTKRIERIQDEIKMGKLSTAQLIDRRMMLKDAELSLEHTNQLLKDLTKPPQKQSSKKN